MTQHDMDPKVITLSTTNGDDTERIKMLRPFSDLTDKGKILYERPVRDGSGRVCGYAFDVTVETVAELDEAIVRGARLGARARSSCCQPEGGKEP